MMLPSCSINPQHKHYLEHAMYTKCLKLTLKGQLDLVQNPVQPRACGVRCTLLVQGSLKRGTRQDIEFELFHLPRMSACPHVRMASWHRSLSTSGDPSRAP